MTSERAAVVFFDIGNTLVQVRAEADGQLVLDVFPGVISILEHLRSEGLRLGIISNTRRDFTREEMQTVLEEAHISDFFSSDLQIYSSVVGIQKDSVVIFCFAADQAGFAHERNRCVFVGEDLMEQHYAREAGFRVAATPAEALDIALEVSG